MHAFISLRNLYLLMRDIIRGKGGGKEREREREKRRNRQIEREKGDR
jgi:hypothetical protein